MKTIKGLGLKNAECDKLGTFHSSNQNEQYQNTFGYHANIYLQKKITKDPKIHLINPAMTHNTGFDEFQKKFPKNYHDVGISEEHAISYASGMQKVGLKPILIFYSTFLQRGYDQILHDLARINQPILFLIDRADLSPSDGSTHHGIYDVSFLKTIPNVTITSPRNFNQLEQLIDLGLSNKNQPFFIRYPKKPFINQNILTNYHVSLGK